MEVGEGGGERFGAEPNPRAEHEHERGGDAQGAREPLIRGFATRPAFGNEQRTVISAPEDEGPVRPVPQAAEEHDDGEVRVGAPAAEAVSAQWNVKVIPQKRAERNVPAPPEVRDAVRAIRRVEIFHELKAEHPAE